MAPSRRKFLAAGTAALPLGLRLDGVQVFSPEGKAIGRIELPERCANLCFGGRHRNRLFLCGSTSLFSLYVNAQGAPGG